jgi:hypothetical protein
MKGMLLCIASKETTTIIINLNQDILKPACSGKLISPEERELV